MTEGNAITGRCECGQVQYTISGEINSFSHCHCSKCRRISGAAFVSWAGVNRIGFAYTSGQEILGSFKFSERATSYFCSQCGSGILIDDGLEADEIYVRVGTINDPVEFPPQFHEFVGSKASWWEITDDFPQFHEASDE